MPIVFEGATISGGISIEPPPPIIGTKAVFGYGQDGVNNLSMTNLVSNTGVVASDTTGVGTARSALAATGYGTDKSIFGYGISSVNVSITNLVTNIVLIPTKKCPP